MNKDKFYTELQQFDLTGRDNFYTHLLSQEITYWLNYHFYENDQISEDDFNYIVTRRGFNEDETNKLKQIVEYINQNYLISDEYKFEYINHNIEKEFDKIMNENFKNNEQLLHTYRDKFIVNMLKFITNFDIDVVRCSAIESDCNVAD